MSTDRAPSRLYFERAHQIEAKLEEVRAGRAPEYLQPLEDLQDNMRIRIEVAGMARALHFVHSLSASLKRIKLFHGLAGLEWRGKPLRTGPPAHRDLLFLRLRSTSDGRTLVHLDDSMAPGTCF